MPSYGWLTRFKDRWRGWRDGTRHIPRLTDDDDEGDVDPAGYWPTLRQLPASHYAAIDQRLSAIGRPIPERLHRLKVRIDLLSIQVQELDDLLKKAETQAQPGQQGHGGPASGNREDSLRRRRNARRRELAQAGADLNSWSAAMTNLEQQAANLKAEVYEHACERFWVYIGRLTSYHRHYDIIRAAVKSRFKELGPIPPTSSFGRTMGTDGSSDEL